ncbi:hypothetical protein VNO77_25985 [Canavalia gladiata]|uniref:Uncharacterized protein n=1 Tax=Canavalia gladiata TaxID=3824 RepID=A0AAN9KUF3_CANGL
MCFPISTSFIETRQSFQFWKLLLCMMRTRIEARMESLERGIKAWKEELETRRELLETRLKRIEELLEDISLRQQQTNSNGVDGDHNSTNIEKEDEL